MLWLSSMKQCISSAPFVVGVKNSFLRFRWKIILYVRCRELHIPVRCYVSFHSTAKAAKQRSPSGRTLRKWSDHLPHFLNIAKSRTQSRAEMYLADRIGSEWIWVALPYSFLLGFSNLPVQVRKYQASISNTSASRLFPKEVQAIVFTFGHLSHISQHSEQYLVDVSPLSSPPKWVNNDSPERTPSANYRLPVQDHGMSSWNIDLDPHTCQLRNVRKKVYKAEETPQQQTTKFNLQRWNVSIN